MNDLSARYQEVESKIQSACLAAGRKRGDVELIVVTKNHSVNLAIQLFELGHRNFGENRDQEASQKAREFSELHPQSQPNWNFIGQLQSNKVKSVVRYAKSLHSLDRLSLLKELIKQLENTEVQLEVFIELNLTEDSNRGGIAPGGLLDFAAQVRDSKFLKLMGVMAVASLGVDPRADFETALAASEQLQELHPEAKYLSMGMSEDFEMAIELGATHIRVGSAITGPRPLSA